MSDPNDKPEPGLRTITFNIDAPSLDLADYHRRTWGSNSFRFDPQTGAVFGKADSPQPQRTNRDANSLRKKLAKLVAKQAKNERFEGDDISGWDMSGLSFEGANLSGMDLSGGDFSGCNFSHAVLSAANLSGANLSGATLYKTRLDSANLRDANLSQASCHRATFKYANLTGANLRDARLLDCSFDHANLNDANLSGVNASAANFNRATLIGADLTGAKLGGAIFAYTNLNGAKGFPNAADMLRQFERDEQGIIVYKAMFVGVDGSHGGVIKPFPGRWKIEPGAVLTETVNPDRSEACTSGIHFSTLDQIYTKWVSNTRIIHGHISVWKCRIEWLDLADVVVPYDDPLDMRCGRLTLLEIVRRGNAVEPAPTN